jgi:hypothetical protein
MQDVEKSKSNLIACKCFSCPSYAFACKVESMPSNVLLLIGNMDKKVHAEKLFCAYEKSDCITEEKGCLCPTCEVQINNKLEHVYYCLENEGK